ncbi:hypothetical protein B0H19DRAFT_1154019 [Mycena capillaripes]|nr:hypothetical protein B0H19DRAFT_1154019 [Mycena capillaripes]
MRTPRKHQVQNIYNKLTRNPMDHVEMAKISHLIAILGLILNPVKGMTTAEQTEEDISALTVDTNEYDSAINAFPASGLVGALNIHNLAGIVESDIMVVASDTVPGGMSGSPPPWEYSETDSGAIVSVVKVWEADLQTALTQLVGKQPSFAALPIGGIPALILQDLKNLNADVTTMGNNLVNAVDPAFQANVSMVFSSLQGSFETAITAYS